MAILAYGGLAEYAVAPAAETYVIPRDLSFAEAGAFPIAYISSHVALRWQGRLEPGETLLVLGAAGGVGLTAVEIGKAMGARVIAARQHGGEAGRGHGARRRRHGELRQREADRAGDGADRRQGRRCLLRSRRRRAVRCGAVGARLGRAHPAGRLRRRRAADPGQSSPGEASRRAGLVAALFPLARTGQARAVRSPSCCAGTAKASSGPASPTACRWSARWRGSAC